eukprot:CAMPEP_0116073548 /NCGR_PEP_ID=MMETSP0322-20121206/15313_1 /TAXON_ID=163516 /ORGANISM="Leptocylindrus danicus var. apora, Strain B651" /LENGTH=177 /DNA_ID=CAMNT_0003562853 /DNA_START=208 /DNA_END=742 /DNA_ORIENTATION=-
MGKSKKKKENKKSLEMYDGVNVEEYSQDTSKYGGPHRYFQNSYTVCLRGERVGEEHNASGTSLEEEGARRKCMSQVIHRHANGLCVITVGEGLEKNIDRVEFAKSLSSDHKDERKESASNLSLSNVKRDEGISNKKRQKMKLSESMVLPKDVLARVYLVGEDSPKSLFVACMVPCLN